MIFAATNESSRAVVKGRTSEACCCLGIFREGGLAIALT